MSSHPTHDQSDVWGSLWPANLGLRLEFLLPSHRCQAQGSVAPTLTRDRGGALPCQDGAKSGHEPLDGVEAQDADSVEALQAQLQGKPQESVNSGLGLGRQDVRGGAQKQSVSPLKSEGPCFCDSGRLVCLLLRDTPIFYLFSLGDKIGVIWNLPSPPSWRVRPGARSSLTGAAVPTAHLRASTSPRLKLCPSPSLSSHPAAASGPPGSGAGGRLSFCD